jgi:hypothetical protein
MSLRVSVPLLVLVFAPGCVPTPEPVGDIDTAKPDERLLGTWTISGTTVVVDRSPVKGHPKGLLRVRAWDKGKDAAKDEPNETAWVFTTTVGKHTYGNQLVDTGHKNVEAKLGTEGAYEKWLKSETKGYFVGKLTFDGDVLALDAGDNRAVEALMTKEKIKPLDKFHAIPAGWLAKYFETNGPDALFPGKDVQKYTRVKAK